MPTQLQFMHAFSQETLIQILEGEEGVDLASYGRPRDGFQLSIPVPHWVSGYGGKYEMRHTNVPAGVMIAVGNLEELDMSDDNRMKAQLKEIDIYPTGHSGDFSGQDLKTLQDWFFSRSRLDNEVNNQIPIAHAKKLTLSGLGVNRFNALVAYLTDNMNLFKNPDVKGVFVPADRKQREQIVIGLLDGLSKTVRYTRLDDPAKAFQIVGQVLIEKGDGSSIHMHMAEEAKILVLRKHKNGEKDITPLDRAMIGKTYVTVDGQPLGERGTIDLAKIVTEASKIESAKTNLEPRPTEPLSFIRVRELAAVNT